MTDAAASNIETYGNEADWLKARQPSIGGSEVAAAVGLDPRRGRFALWAEKTRKVEPIASDLLMRVGHDLEPRIHAETEAADFGLEDPGPYTIYRSPDQPWRHMTLDRIWTKDNRPLADPVDVRRVAEFKTVTNAADWSDEEPSKGAILQVTHGMDVTGWKDKALVSALFGLGWKFRTYEVDYNTDLSAVLAEALEEFWGYVTRDEPPPVDATEGTKRALALLYPKDTGGKIEIPQCADDFRNLHAVKAELKRLEQEKALAENRIKAALGTASYGEIPGYGSVSFKLIKRKGYFVQPSEHRQLREVSYHLPTAAQEEEPA